MKTLKLTFLLLAALFFNACSDESPDPQIPKGDYENGFFISNEGPFQNGSGSITFVGEDGIAAQNVYKTVNNEDLGNIVNSITLAGDNAYIVVNNSQKVIVANRFTMKKITTIEGPEINNPRYFVVIGSTGYLSNWGDPLNKNDDFISVIDLNTNTVSTTISVGEGPENMQIVNTDLFVALEGGYSQNNKVVVIDTQSNAVTAEIEVGDVPNAMISDNSGSVWVLCGGKPSWTGNETAGALYQINVGNYAKTALDFNITDHPEHLALSENNMYYNLNGKIYEMDSKAGSLPVESVAGLDGFYYTLKINNGELYATDAKDYNSEGVLKVFDLTTLTLVQTISTGIIPGDIAFQ